MTRLRLKFRNLPKATQRAAGQARLPAAASAPDPSVCSTTRSSFHLEVDSPASRPSGPTVVKERSARPLLMGRSQETGPSRTHSLPFVLETRKQGSQGAIFLAPLNHHTCVQGPLCSRFSHIVLPETARQPLSLLVLRAAGQMMGLGEDCPLGQGVFLRASETKG